MVNGQSKRRPVDGLENDVDVATRLQGITGYSYSAHISQFTMPPPPLHTQTPPPTCPSPSHPPSVDQHKTLPSFNPGKSLAIKTD